METDSPADDLSKPEKEEDTKKAHQEEGHDDTERASADIASARDATQGVDSEVENLPRNIRNSQYRPYSSEEIHGRSRRRTRTGEVTTKALLRNNKLRQALAEIKTTAVRGWEELDPLGEARRYTTVDEIFAARIECRLEYTASRIGNDPGRHKKGWRFVIEERHRRNHGGITRLEWHRLRKSRAQRAKGRKPEASSSPEVAEPTSSTTTEGACSDARCSWEAAPPGVVGSRVGRSRRAGRRTPRGTRRNPLYEFLTRELNPGRRIGSIEEIAEVGGNWAPPEVYKIQHPQTGRTVFLHSFQARLIQRLILLTMKPLFEARMMDFAHAYRSGRSIYTALSDARAHIRNGKKFAAVLDIRQFFQTINGNHIRTALGALFPEVTSDLTDLILAQQFPERIVTRGKPEGPACVPPPIEMPVGYLLEGSVIAPMVAEIVACHFVDQPFMLEIESADTEEPCRLLRFADDMIVLGDTAQNVAGAAARVVGLLRSAGFDLNEAKTRAAPVDVTRYPIAWLGKELHGGVVRTPRKAMEQMIFRIIGVDPASREFAAAVGDARQQLQLDPPKWIEMEFKRILRRRSRYHATALVDRWDEAAVRSSRSASDEYLFPELDAIVDGRSRTYPF